MTTINAPAAVAAARVYRPDIDGLRSLAILSVVLFHAGIGWLPGGFTGVDIFFVISGYLIGGHIHAEIQSGVFRFSSFYRSRAKRILPALYVVLVGVLALGLILFSPNELRDLARCALATTASAANFALWKTTGYFAPKADQNPLLMTWSLGVEEQFYLVIPVLLVLFARFRKHLSLPLVGVITVASFVLACRLVVTSPNTAFYLPHARAWELGVGVMLAIYSAQSGRFLAGGDTVLSGVAGIAGLVLTVAPMLLLRASTPFPGLAAAPSVMGAALLLASGGSWVNSRVLSLRPLVLIGRVSYSWYLWHWPLLAFVRVLRGGDLPQAWGLAVVTVALGLAAATYFWVEGPFRASKLAAGPLLVRYGVVSLLLLLVCGAIFAVKGLPQRYPAVAALDRTVLGEQSDPCLAQSGESAPHLAGVCTGAEASGKHIAVWGDSHASALAVALRASAAQQGYFLEEYTKTTCPPLLNTGRYYRATPSIFAECVRFNLAVLERLVADPQVDAVALEAYWEAPFDPSSDTGKLFAGGSDTKVSPTEPQSEQLLQSALRATVQALITAGKRVIVFGDVPVFQADPLWRMRTSGIPARMKLTKAMLGPEYAIDSGMDTPDDMRQEQRRARQLVEQTASSLPGASFWDLRKELCAGEGPCRYRNEYQTYFTDTNHLSPAGGRQALEGWTVPLAAGHGSAATSTLGHAETRTDVR